MSGTDKGGRPPGLTNLQDNFSEQQAKITALKELVRQSDQSQNQEAQEKVKNIAQRLNVLKSKATKSRLEKSSLDLDSSRASEMDFGASATDLSLDGSHSESRTRAETPGSEKIQLLRQQMELNRRKMAERESSKRDIEVMVSQLKAKFDDTQQSLHRSAELGRSMGDLSSIGHTTDRDRIRQLEAKVRILETELADSEGGHRVKALQTRILDLEDTIKEKDSLIQARTQAVTLMTESMSKKGKNTVDLLEDTQQEMIRMQENFVQSELSLKDEIDLLNQQIHEKDGKIANLEGVVEVLETTRFDLTVKNAELLNQINDVQEYSAKLEELNRFNQQLQHRIADLEQQLTSPEAQEADINQKSEYLAASRELEKENRELKSQIEKMTSAEGCPDTDFAERFAELEKSLQEQTAISLELEEKLTEKTVELSVLQANFNVLDEKLQSTGPKSLFSSTTVDEDDNDEGGNQTEVLKLKSQLDEANKSQIKTKLKMKQMQKQMDSLKKASDQNRQILQLQEENQQLQQKLSDLLQHVESDAVMVADDSDMAKKIQALELTCHNQTSAIKLLEEQKLDLVDDLSETRGELDHLRAQMDAKAFSTVKSEISSIELEEQLELHMSDKASLTLQVEDLNEIVSNLKEQMRKLKEEKSQMDNENQKLLEKLDKLSEKVSSAESIEILENLTQQERMEMESTMKKGEDDNDGGIEKLKEESSELTQKIELFETERKEVLEKMERVKAENAELLTRIAELEDKERQLLEDRDELKGKYSKLEESLSKIQTESKVLSEKVSLMEKLESDSSSSPGTPQKTTTNRDTLEGSLKSLDTEVENYMKCKDKNGKLATSKKLAKQAKNCVTHFREFLDNSDLSSNSGQSEEVQKLKELLLETTSVRVEKEQLEEELRSVRTALLEANNAQEDMRGQITVLLAKLNQKDELLEEHETDTAKLLADIKLLQESAQEKADSEIEQQLKQILQEKEKELEKSRKSIQESEETNMDLSNELEGVRSEMADLIHQLADQERRQAAFDVEKATMKELIDEQKKQLIEQLVDHETELNEKISEIAELEAKLGQAIADLQSASSNNQQRDEGELSRLREEITFKQDTIETLNNQIMDLYKSMDGNTNALLEKEDEIVYLKDIIESNNTRLEDLEQKCRDYETKIQEMEIKLREVEEKNSRAANATDDVKIGLEQRIQELEAIVQELDTKNKEQLEKLKKFAANLKKKVAQCNELEEELKKRGEEKHQEADSSEKDELLEMRQRQIEDCERKIQNLEERMEQLTEELNVREDEMAMAENTAKQWEKRCQELERQLGELKAFADNRESEEKVAELERALGEATKKLDVQETSIKEMNDSKLELEEKITSLTASLDVKGKEVEKCKIIIKKRMKEIQELKQQQSSQPAGQNFAQEEVIQTLRGQVQEMEVYRSQAQMMETKIQENSLYIESLETENREMNSKIQKLEEGIATIEERRNSMEQKVNFLGATLQEKSSEFQQNEDMLVQRLSSLSAHDEVIVNQLQATQQENEDLRESVEEHIKQEMALTTKLKDVEGELQKVREQVIGQLEQEISQLNYQLTHESQEKKKYAEDLEKRLQAKDKEIEDMENELSGQFVKFEEERRMQQEQQEKLLEEGEAREDELKQSRETVSYLEGLHRTLQAEITQLRAHCDTLNQDDDEVKELRMQVVQDQTEIEHLRHQNVELSQSHEQELDRLRCEIINLQENSHMDLLRSDLEKFQRELMDKEQLIETLQRRYDEEVKSSQSKSDLIDTLASKVHDINEKQLSDFNGFSETINALKVDLQQKDHELANHVGEISRNAQIIHEMQWRLDQQQKELSQQGSGSGSAGAAAEDQVEMLKKAIEAKDIEIANYQQRTLQLQMAASMGGGGGGNDPFASPFAGSVPHQEQQQPNVEEIKRECNQRISAMEETLKAALERTQFTENELVHLVEKYSLTQKHLLDKETDLQRLAQKFHETQSLCLAKNAEVERLHGELVELQDHLARQQSAQAINELVQVAEQHVLDAAAVPVQEELFVQQSSAAAPGQVYAEIVIPQSSSSPFHLNVDSEMLNLKEDLERLHLQLTEKALELDMALTRIKELEAERVVKKEAVTKVSEKQVAQVSPQQIPDGSSSTNIPAFSTAQFFDPPPQGTASFFGGGGGAASGGDVTDYENRVPVEEEMIVPKTAYLCYPDAATEIVQPDSSSMTPNVDDSWGWNAEEAILEEQHHRMTYQAAPVNDQRMQQLEDTIQELILERDRQRAEIHEFQLKSAKMLKKLREYKALNENLNRQRSMDSANDLDLAIQEELKEQVKALEARLKEDSEKKDKEQTERESMNGRISQLAATNSRLTEMKQQQELEIERHLTEIRHLRNELQKMSNWDDESFSGGAKKEEMNKSVGESDPQVVKELESKITDLAADNDELQALLEEEKDNSKQLEEKLRRVTERQIQSEASQQRIEELERQLKESMEFIDKLTRDSQDIKVHLDRLGTEHKEKINENVLLQDQLQQLSKKNSEFTALLHQNQGNDKQVQEELEERLQNLISEMEYKNSDNMQMKDKIASQSEALEVAEDNLRSKEQVIDNLKENLKEVEEKLKEALLREKQSAAPEDVPAGRENSNWKTLYENLQVEKASMEQELQVLNDQVIASLEMEDKMKATVLEFDLKQIEINELKSTIEQLKAGKEAISIDSVNSGVIQEEVDQLKAQIEQLNTYWADAVEQRGNEVAESWKNHLEVVQQDYQSRISSLQLQLDQLLANETEYQRRIAALEEKQRQIPQEEQPQQKIAILPTNEQESTSSPEDDIQAMRLALESQEMEIVTLKEQLAIRSAEFAALSARLDPYGHRATSNMASVQPKLNKPSAGGFNQPGGSGITTTGGQGGLQAKKREQNELDLALYMLHQRDMRCEELTHELLILLEERDTLQLKLSDSIRQLEVNRRDGGSGAVTTSGESSENNSPEKSSTTTAGGVEGSIGGDILDAKLQSIHESSVGRGKALREERDERLRQMAKLQQDIANIPQEAVTEIVGDYSTAESNQSPSSVLMSWLWGNKSAPRPDQ